MDLSFSAHNFLSQFFAHFSVSNCFPLPSPLPYHLSFGHVVANFLKRKIANDFFCARERALELVLPHTPSRLSYSLCLINVGMMAGRQPRRNGTTNNKSRGIEKKKRRKKTDGWWYDSRYVGVSGKKRPVKRVSRRWKMIRRFWIERVYERYHGMEQLKPLLHLSFRLWFFRSMFWGNFHREWIRWNEAAHKTPNRRLRKKSLFLLLREDDVEMKTFQKKSCEAQTERKTRREQHKQIQNNVDKGREKNFKHKRKRES